MNNLIPFDFEGDNFRILWLDGEPWFVGKDVAEILGYANPDQALHQHCKSLKRLNSLELRELGIADAPSAGLMIIPESDLYRLTSRSHKVSAVRFMDRVYGEILPSIRKTGRYGGASVHIESLRNPDVVLGLLAHYASQTKDLSYKLDKAIKEKDDIFIEMQRSITESNKLSTKLDAVRPAIEFHRRVGVQENEFGLQVAGKILLYGANRFVKKLSKYGLYGNGDGLHHIYKRCEKSRWLPMSHMEERGILRTRIRILPDEDLPPNAPTAEAYCVVTIYGMEYYATILDCYKNWETFVEGQSGEFQDEVIRVRSSARKDDQGFDPNNPVH